jgi:hypothetical protein
MNNIPKVHFGALQGFLEVLDHLGGYADIANIASRQKLELDDLLPVLEAGEILGFVRIQSGDVSLTERGHLFIEASPKVKKKILREIILNLAIFKQLVDFIRRSEKGSVTKEEALDQFLSSKDLKDTEASSSSPPIATTNTTATTTGRNDQGSTSTDVSNYDPINDFDWLIDWGRQALILKYDANTQSISLRSKAV